MEFAREYVSTGAFTLRRQQEIIYILIFMGLAYAWVTWNWTHHGGQLEVLDYPLVKLRHYGVAVLLVLLFFAWKKTGFRGFDGILAPFEIFAGMSYALYALHFPLICEPQLITAPSLLWLNAAVKIILVLTLAYWAEGFGQKYANRWLDYFISLKIFFPIEQRPCFILGKSSLRPPELIPRSASENDEG